MFLTDAYKKQNWQYISNRSNINGVTEKFEEKERFSTRWATPKDAEEVYGKDQANYTLLIAEVALAMSALLENVQNDTAQLASQFHRYTQGNQSELDWAVTCPEAFKEKATIDTLKAFTNSFTERFFSEIAAHRQVIAAAKSKAIQAPETDTTAFGRNRYEFVFKKEGAERKQNEDLYELKTCLSGRYRCVVDRFLETSHYKKYLENIKTTIKPDELFGPDGYNIRRTLNTQPVLNVGYLSDLGKIWLHNTFVSDEDYKRIYAHLDSLMLPLITEDNSPRDFLKAVIEIQFWFIHIMPYRRGSAAVMQIFLFVMIAFYNRKAANSGKSMLPLAPNRTGYLSDLDALFVSASLDDFIKRSFSTIYCVDYTKCC